MGLTLDDYCKIIPSFHLYFSFTKSEIEIYHILMNSHKDDFLQTIALSIFEGEANTKQNINNILKKNIYYLITRISDYKKINKTTTLINNKKYYLSQKTRICDICKQKTNHYVYKTLIPGKDVCRICRNRIVRQDKKRNKL